MDLFSKFRKVKKPGNFHVNVKKTRQLFNKHSRNREVNVIKVEQQSEHTALNYSEKNAIVVVATVSGAINNKCDNVQIVNTDNNLIGPENSAEKSTLQDLSDENFRNDLKAWCIQNNITHNSLKQLLLVLKKTSLRQYVPLDPRTLLETEQNIQNIRIIGNEQLYWHYGIENCLRECFWNVDKSMTISLNINIDGLPLFKRSSNQFWPILANVHGMPQYKVLVIGIYCGKGKPHSIEAFLRPFVDEMNILLQSGVLVNGYNINIGVHAFICDSPARSFLKGKNS